MKPFFNTELGKLYLSESESLLRGSVGKKLKGKVNLIMTSPPFPLNQKKSYGNKNGDTYKDWFVSLAPVFAELLAPDGSIVIEIGNAWESERPVQSLLPLRCLLDFAEHPDAGLRLCQESVCYNPARLPSPAQWVTINRVRMTDSYTHVWWLAKSDNPKADNRRALRPYSASMERLLKRQSYNAGKRPSEHVLSETSFLTDHGGSIAQNLFEIEPIHPGDEPRLPNAFRIANTRSSDAFSQACRREGITPHPARMPEGLVSFYTELLTEPGDLILDPFAGSCTTGSVAERLGRRWIGVEIQDSYAQQAKLRFEDILAPDKKKVAK
jgi:site-specific DNA-methyltransferase (cytosine-N4-specific)